MQNLDNVEFQIKHLQTLNTNYLDLENQTSKEYIHKYFYKSQCGNIFFYNGSEFQLYDTNEIKKNISNDCDKKIKEIVLFSVHKYLNSTQFIEKTFRTAIDFQQQKIFSKIYKNGVMHNYINMAKSIDVPTTRNEEIKIDANL